MSSKRIVLQHTRGPYRGLHQIVGDVDQLKENLKVTELPEFLPDINFGTRKGPVSLVAIKERFVLYREIMNPDATIEQHPQQR